MVPPQHEKVLRILDLVRKEQADSLERLLASIHVITEEEVVGFWRKTAVFEKTQEVVVLAVDVACAAARVDLSTGGEVARHKHTHRRS